MGKWKDFVSMKFCVIQKCYDMGWRQVGRYVGILNLVLIIFTYLTVRGVPNSVYLMVGMFFGAIFAMLVFGYFYLKTGLMQKEYSVLFYENKPMQDIWKDIRIIKNSLGIKEVEQK